MRNQLLLRIFGILALYLGLKYYGGDVGKYVLYPITRLVTFLHEFGHALGAILTGGSVDALQVNADGSGYAITRGGSRAIILMGGYIGSALLGNLIFFVGARKPNAAKFTMYALAAMMAFSGVFWFNSLYTTGFLFLFAVGLCFIAAKTSINREVLMFLGLASIIYIIQDFNVGPSSDLQKYAELFVVIPQAVWMYIWLAIVIVLFILNLRLILKTIPNEVDSPPLK